MERTFETTWGLEFKRLWLPPLALSLAASLVFHVFICGCLSWRTTRAVLPASPIDLTWIAMPHAHPPASPRSTVRPPVRPVPDTDEVEAPPAVAPPENSITALAPSPAVGAPTEDPRLLYLDRLRTALEQRKHYPPAARALGQSGTVLVRISIAREGTFLDAKVLESSGFPRLDQAATSLVTSLGAFETVPFGQEAPWNIEIPVAYEAD